MYSILSKLVYRRLQERDEGWSRRFDELVDQYAPPEVSTHYATTHPKLSARLNKAAHLVRRVIAFALARFAKKRSSLNIFSAKALDVLCDIQLVTGTGILIAALAQGERMTFYHQQFVMNYWFICLNSFWVARSGEMSQNEDDDFDEWHFWTRTTAILVSACLSIYYQIVTIPRQHWGAKGEWDPVKPGYCFLSHDTSSYEQQFLWIAGLICYSAYLVFILVSGLASLTSLDPKLESQWKEFANNSNSKWKDLRSRVQTSTQAFCRHENSVNHVDDPRPRDHGFSWLLMKIVKEVSYFVWGFSKQFLALWAWGDIHSPFIVAAYWGFTAWNTYDIIDLKHSNTILVADETKWGFGQVLPVVLLGLVVLNLMDAAQGEDCPSYTIVALLIVVDARKQTAVDRSRSSASEHSLEDLQPRQHSPSNQTALDGGV